MSKNVLVLAEVKDGNLRQVTYEAIHAAKIISQGGEVTAAFLGTDGDKYAKNLAEYGADRVVVVKNEALNQYTTDAYRQALFS